MNHSLCKFAFKVLDLFGLGIMYIVRPTKRDQFP